MPTVVDNKTIEFYGYTISANTSQKSKDVIKTLAECGCVEVEFSDDSMEQINQLMVFAAEYGITVYKSDYSFILCDTPVRRKI